MKKRWMIFALLMVAAGMFVLVSCGKKDSNADHPKDHPTGEHPKEHPAEPAEKPESGAVPEEKAEIELVGNTTCPVMEGNAVKEGLFVDVKGKRINICCKGCIKPIQEDPDKYLSKVKKGL